MSNKNDEEVNLEYLRNVVLQFLEHKEMRVSASRLLPPLDLTVVAYSLISLRCSPSS